MSINLFVYLESTPSLDEIRVSLAAHGLVYRHTLPPDDRWGYPMHVFGRENVRVVYHAGDPLKGEAVVDSMIERDSPHAHATVQLILMMLVRHYGGTICDPKTMGRGAVL